MKNFHQWRIGTINIRTGKYDEKLERTVHEIHKAKLSICCMQEVRRIKTGSALITIDNQNYEIYWSGLSLKRIHGVGITVKVDKDIIVEEIKNINARIIVADVNVYGCSVRIINCYAPTEDDTSTSKDTFYTMLRKQFHTEPTRKIICLGDFNATTSAAWYNSSLREHVIIDDLEVNNNGERFHYFFNTQKLSVINTWFSHRKCRRITWHSPDGVTKKVYDFILSCAWLRQYVKNCRVYNSYDFGSDHRLVIATIETPCTKRARFKHRQKTTRSVKLDLAALKNDNIATAFKDQSLTALATIDKEQNNTSINEAFVTLINEAASNTLPPKTNSKLFQPWHDDKKLKQLYQQKDELILKFPDSNKLKALKKKIRLRARYLRNEYLKREAERINQLAINRELEKLYHRAKQQGKTLKSAIHTCDPHKIINHFKSHFNPPDPSKSRTPQELERRNLPIFLQKLQDISRNTQIDNSPPTVDEIERQIKLLKNNKASNDVAPDLLKVCNHPIMNQVIHRMALNLWNNLDFPEAWSNSHLKTLWKNKGSKSDPTKYRGISIGSTVCKLIINIILDRLRPWYESQLSEEQNGFRQNRGTTDGIFTLKRVQQITHRKMQPLFLLFIDLTAAFDHIPRSWLFKSIEMRFPEGMFPRLFTILDNLYKRTTLTFDKTKSTFQTTSGVRQGGPESPFLFNLFIDYVMRVFINKSQNENIKFYEHHYRINCRTISREIRLQMRLNDQKFDGNMDLPWCGYADDLILFIQSRTDLQKAADLLDQIFDHFGLKINELKTETMILNNSDEPEYPKSIITLRNTPINNVEKFKYLGAFIKNDQPNTGDVELTYRIQVALSKFVEMSTLLQNVKINLKTRILFLNSFIRSRLTYSCQNWNLTVTQHERIDAAYRNLLRRMIRGGFNRMSENDHRFRINNEKLHSLCGTSDVSIFVKKQQMNYCQHLIRMPHNRIPKLLLFNEDKYTKKGRPSKSLLEQVIENESLTLDRLCNNSIKKKEK